MIYFSMVFLPVMTPTVAAINATTPFGTMSIPRLCHQPALEQFVPEL